MTQNFSHMTLDQMAAILRAASWTVIEPVDPTNYEVHADAHGVYATFALIDAEIANNPAWAVNPSNPGGCAREYVFAGLESDFPDRKVEISQDVKEATVTLGQDPSYPLIAGNSYDFSAGNRGAVTRGRKCFGEAFTPDQIGAYIAARNAAYNEQIALDMGTNAASAKALPLTDPAPLDFNGPAP